MKSAAPIAVAFREVRHFRPDDSLHCEAIEVRGKLHDWTIPAHRHDGLHQFQWLERGRMQLTLDHVPHDVEAPAALVVAPGCVHAFAYAPESAGHQVTVPSTVLQKAFGGTPALAARLGASRVLDRTAIGDEAPLVRERFARLAAEFEQVAPGRTEALQAHVVLLATWFLRHRGDASPVDAREGIRDTLVQRYRALVEQHLREQRPLGFYADQLAVTADHLSRACRAVTGQSALELMHERLAREARRLLAYTDAPVADVARELGFADPAYFSRFFARRAGRSPLGYRVAWQNGTAVEP